MKFLTKLYVSGLVMLMSSSIFADQPQAPTKLLALFAHVGDNVKYTIKVTLAVAAIVGLALVTYGIHKIKAHPHESNGTSGNWRTGIMQLVVGGLLFSIPTLALMVGSSFFDSTANIGVKEACVAYQISSGDYNNCSPAPPPPPPPSQNY